ncbi:tRNA (adenosine(37)-N6)-threonylcarbamoyltransferase complex ATPase subunit type 1 TsaE [Mycoplasmopsis pullorum]|uniref:tRNA (adenosine(37)-N6)-threonylcarbamoyltransferase complex ATPase subunit type 1 TsaE n=1 Tax=Mycoplasmopsis pullorum TaxID=48003 RepID=UPI0011190C40|nr:tRNA (adenosine(37)-N6)-threonylcarbamoyltransferase complex ATPase subunit type 1 TsaE [Mycoplasmopsis pullorum]TNK82604.1 tRNA (adenosine(37)-N6)-threonylcarbamoyltransferase complex ATPase subunit type 1 TsaE [Mycoplasmopsis pullorum]TNK83470.1 tRNA (adenosine(37)-N6)-threonylcarbamoyltransferase complex ATPase subunit type 1 TsaE [Mycoplasmopsis pullorum]TNK83503.1 tRNA (adenosine(37)-N6)-threonylcarbamoyltransferase complex ATPase subunit type 1 TsaE [Mycoplasmopsis pullorum]TNK84939.1 
MNLISKNKDDLNQVARTIIDILHKNKIQFLLLSGELGAGKTTLIQEVGKELGIKQKITSPTFNYMKVYPGLVHIDAYNLYGTLDEFEDYFEDNIVAIEWSENLSEKFKKYVQIKIYVNDENHHIYEIKEFN